MQVSDRIPYVFIETSKRDALMGDRIEHIGYVRKSLAAGGRAAVRVDTKLYIQSQIQKPCLQLLGIALEKMPGYTPRPELTGPRAIASLIEAKAGNRAKAQERLDTLREREAERLVFLPALSHVSFRERDNRCNGQSDLHAYFNKAMGAKSTVHCG